MEKDTEKCQRAEVTFASGMKVSTFISEKTAVDLDAVLRKGIDDRLTIYGYPNLYLFEKPLFVELSANIENAEINSESDTEGIAHHTMQRQRATQSGG